MTTIVPFLCMACALGDCENCVGVVTEDRVYRYVCECRHDH